ncbi:hypothetical protein GQ651_02820 [Alphaproteobacteria bacterium GH1-50]|uniref:Uncharacterized protein n=1 Tax=Kangsaoukella pontilimi TaxID=2691042 RepID=A0A7C9MBZ3_9RHOB|nr:hypothetical protein [Kangsaoukella pontilimi]MXQ06772.1 hypothetical protein [Kangsaoukella pontilimi]
MKDLPATYGDRDDVDHLIDRLLADPGTVEDVKTLLRHKMSAPDVIAVAPVCARSLQADRAEEDVEDMWDNVPI